METFFASSSSIPPSSNNNHNETISNYHKQPNETRAGGAYIPPAKLRAMQAAITDKSSLEYQRMTWEALKKSINGLVNKVNTNNFKNIIPELFSENLLRGQGLLCKSLMKAQAASLQFTPVFAAVAAIVNIKIPSFGDLLLSRLIVQYRKALKRGDTITCIAGTKFLCHLVNQEVADDLLIMQIITTLLQNPTDDSVEMAVSMTREVGAYLMEFNARVLNYLMDEFNNVLQEGKLNLRTEYIVEVLFAVRKEKFKDNPAVPSELDLVEEGEQIIHSIGLDDVLDTKESLNVFRYDKDFLKHEAEYDPLRREVLGDSDEANGGNEVVTDKKDKEARYDEESCALTLSQQQVQIQETTNQYLINLRHSIYLTIMSSVSFEECIHKLMKLGIPKGQGIEVANMIIQCCSHERTYVDFYGLIGERLCKLNEMWAETFAQSFEETFKIVDRYETNRIRIIGKYFAYLLATDSLTWCVFALVKLTETDTTSSSRIFIKILFQELVETIGLNRLNERLRDPRLVIQVPSDRGPIVRGVFDGLFPKDNPRNTRFAINYLTSIGLGGLTFELREHLKNAPKAIMAQQRAAEDADSDSDSDSSSDSNTSSDSDSDSDSDSRD